ncbi:MAG: CoA transferase [Alphaproteobacteria bacterium]|nr:CoA transferase [Alphaproteobacteria bacterium]MCB9928111.1 CoA transferase [Alphaproteobacteria bacterium]
MPGPLDGFRILDLSAVISGPYATMILADQGADVIKIEPPGSGDFTRSAGNQQGGLSASFLNNNRNKRSVVLDLKRPDHITALKRIAATADAMVQNFRPGVVERLGIGYEDMKAVKPDLVYVSISGFGEVGPWSHKPVYDPIVQALSGLCSVQGGSDERRPRLIRTIVPDKVTALTASQAITAALLARSRTGKGQHVRLSMLDAIVAFLWSSDMGSQTYVDKEVSLQRAASFLDLIYETTDGYMAVSTMTNGQWQAFCRASGHPHWIDDPRFATTALRDLNIDARLELIQSAMITKSTDAWMAILDEAGVPCAPVLHRREMIQHPQVVANGVVREYDHPQAGRLRQSRPAARFEGTEPEHRFGARQLGEDSAQVLAEVGYSAEEVQALLTDG